MGRLHNLAVWVAAAAQPECDVHQAHQDRHLDEWSDDAGERLTRRDAENTNGYGNSKLKVVTSSREREGRRFRIPQAQPVAERETPPEHDREVDEQRCGNTHDV